MLVIQIRIVEREEYNLVIVYSKNEKEVKNTFFSKTPKKIVKKNIICEINSRT